MHPAPPDDLPRTLRTPGGPGAQSCSSFRTREALDGHPSVAFSAGATSPCSQEPSWTDSFAEHPLCQGPEMGGGAGVTGPGPASLAQN